MSIIQEINDTEFRINERITEIDEKIELISVEWDQAFEKWTLQMIASEELRQLDEMFRNQQSVPEKERKVVSTEKNYLNRSSTEDADSFEDRQEPKINIESEIDNKESDDEMDQFIESVETENLVDDLSQAQQQQESQHQTVEVKTIETIVQDRQQLQSPEPEQLLSIDSPIKMVDIYAMQEELKWSVISEIEGHIIEPVADYKLNYGTMESEKVYADSIKKFDTFRGGTESLLYNSSAIIFQKSNNKIMETIMFGTQTAKQFQRNDQKYQVDMKDNPN